ncbi:MAG: DUF4097 domain-containing protein [Candidatus Krumholzibacteria bacterium]|nr:DUF4097 domain-containing protein [Candidatus Krumholzibacteria bacterium]
MRTLNGLMLAALCVFALLPVTDTIGQAKPVAESFKVEKGGNLIVDIENVGADVDVKVWSKLEVAVTAQGIRESDLEDLRIEAEGNTVYVLLDAHERRSHRNVRFSINVPSEFNLDIGTSGGDVQVTGSIKGAVIGSTAGGDIEIDDVDGKVELRSAGGDITAGSVNGDARLRTAGGDIEVGGVTGELTAQTAGGDIEAGTVGKDLVAQTAGGDITCVGVGGKAAAETAGGDIELGLVKGEVKAETAGGDIEIMGATGEANAQTSGGDIRLSGIKGFVDAATAGGDIRVELDPSNAANSSMETKGGDVELYLPANAKVTIEARIRLRGWDRGDRDEYDIHSDFTAEKHEKSEREVWARYVINGGGKVIEIETMNGNIEIRKR